MTHRGRTARNAVAAVAVTLMLTAFSMAEDSETVLHAFTGGKDGAGGGFNLVADSAGNLYGTAWGGGNKSTGCEKYTGTPGCGVVFELSPGGNGTWNETVLYTFTGGKDGGGPIGGVIMDSAGNLYGTTFYGGDEKPLVCHATITFPAGCGVVYKLAPHKSKWTETVLYTFTGGKDGAGPWSRLIFDSNGNLYGTGSDGGDDSCGPPYGCGVVFKLTPNAHGPWKEKVLYTFSRFRDGLFPDAGVTFDSQGNLYGATAIGGDKSVMCATGSVPGCGVVFKLTPAAKGPWTETVLHTFTGGTDGGYPLFYVTLDSSGNVYGTTLVGGGSTNCSFGGGSGCGVVFELAQGTWDETVLYAFTGGNGGGNVFSPAIFDSAGNIYGVANGGVHGWGVVFQLTPAGPPVE